jgi:hemolysin activation/secretion protein
MSRWCVLAPLGLLVALFSGPSGAQDFVPERRPGDERIELPSVEEPEKPVFELPPAPAPEPGRLGAAPRIRVERFEVTGATVFTPEEIEAVTAPYAGHELAAEDLIRLKNELTLKYVNAGYVNSGAVIPDQDVGSGVVRIQIVEGTLGRIDVAKTRWFREDYFRERLSAAASDPLDAAALQERLQIFQQDPRIRRVQAQLEPGDRPGDARLDVRFEEEVPYHVSLEQNNYESPSVGSDATRLGLRHDNLFGVADRLWLSVGRSEGLEDYGAGYEIPINAYDTTLGIDYSFSRSDVVEEPFDALDIKSRSQTAALRVRHPLLRDRNTDLELSGSLEWRESRTFLLGDPFSFTEGPDDGLSRLTVVRVGVDFTRRDLVQVIAMRSLFSTGVGLFHPTRSDDPASVPDGYFFSWLGQFQWLRRFDSLFGVQTIFRTDVQLAASPLLSLEQFSVGGHGTVRGYRENQLVRDNGWVSSLELRIPLFADATRHVSVQLAPFTDIGRSWNKGRGETSPRTLFSAGVGLRVQLTRYLEGQIYWAEPIHEVETPDDRDLQDSGVHFRVSLSY